jgi:molecular chaperone HscB
LRLLNLTNVNYFELFEMPVRLRVDKAEARRRYLELSRRYHPDYHAQAEAAEQEAALQKAALLNKALQTFSSPDATIAYVLRLKGLLEEEEKYTLSPDFLMEMMELNEVAGEAESAEEKVRLRAQLDQLENEIYAPVQEIVETGEEAALTEEALLRVKEYYFRKKYLNRLREQMGGMA